MNPTTQNTNTAAKRGLEILALAMIGEGIIGLIRPAQYARFWKTRPKPLREFTESLAENPNLTRLLCAGEIAVGLCLALREIDE